MGGRGASSAGTATRSRFESHGGLTYVTQDYGGGYGRVGVLAPGKGEVGSINWMPGSNGPVVGDVSVSPGMQRQGIGTQLWKQAQKATGGKVGHSANRTEAGEKFARSVGGRTPSRSKLRPA